MNFTYCSFISGLFFRVRCRDENRLTACSLLFGRSWRGSLNGSGATQLLSSSLKTFLSMISMKMVSSTEGAGLLSCSVQLNTVCPSILSGALSGLLMPCADSLICIKLGQGSKIEGRPLSST